MLCVTNIIIISLSLLFGLTQICTQILPIPNKAPLPKLLNEFIFEQLIRSGASSNKKCKDIYTVESPSSVSVPFLFLSGNPLLLIFWVSFQNFCAHLQTNMNTDTYPSALPRTCFYIKSTIKFFFVVVNRHNIKYITLSIYKCTFQRY